MQLDQLTRNGMGPDPLRRGEPKVLPAPGPSIVPAVTNFWPDASFAALLSTMSCRPASCDRNRRTGWQTPVRPAAFPRAVIDMQTTDPGALTSAAGISRIRPSRLWYVAASVLLAVAVTCLALGVASFFDLNRQIQDFQRFSVPGQALVTFSHPGEYVLYVEGPGHCCSFHTGGGQAPFARWSMRVGLRLVAGGPPVSIRTWRGGIDSYAVTGHRGQTAMYFTIRYPGVYVLNTSDVRPRSIADLAVGRRIGGLFVPIALILAAIFALGPAGLIVGAATAVRRRSHRNRLPPPWSGQPVPGPGPARAPRGPVLCQVPRHRRAAIRPARRRRLIL